MSVIGSLSVKLGLVTQGFDAAINSAKTKMGDLEKSVSAVNKTLGVFGASLGAAALVNAANTVVNFADEVDDLGKAFDLSTAKVLQFRDALGQSGGKAENAERILGSLFDKIETAKNSMVTDDIAKQFAKLGISIQDLKTMNPEQSLTAVFNGLSKIGNTYERVALIKDILGKGGLGLDVKNLASLMDQSSTSFNKNAESIQNLADAADRLARAKEQIKLFGADLINSIAENKALNYLFERTKETLAVLPGIYRLATTGNVNAPPAAGSAKGLMGSMTMPGATMFNAGGLDTSKLFSGMGNVDLSAFGKGTQKQRSFTLGVAQKDIVDEAAIKRLANLKAELELAKQLNEVEIQKGKLSIDALTKDSDSIATREAMLVKEQAIAEADKKLADNQKNALGNAKELTAAQDLYNAELAKANTIYQNSIDLINAKWELQKQEMITQTQSQESFEFGWKSAFQAYAEDAQNAAQLGGDIFNSMTGSMSSAIDNFVQTGKFSFKDFANSVMQDILRIMLRWQMMQIIMGIAGSFSKGASINTDTISSDFVSPGGIVDLSNPNLPRHAAGGYTDRPSIVGENGAELFVPNRPGTIIPNARMGDFMGQQQPQMVVNGTYVANMQAIDTQSATQFLAKNRNAVFAANQSAMRGLPAGR